MIKLSGFYTIDSSNTPFLCNELISIIGPMPYRLLLHIADFAITQQDYTVAFVCVGREKYKEIYKEKTHVR